MKEERMAVLRMLEKGSITAAEAERLILALQNKDKKERIDVEEINETITDCFNKMGDCLGSFVKSVGEKAEDVKKEVEPVVKKMAETMAEKAANAAEDLKNYATAKKKEREEREAAEEVDEPLDAEIFQTMFGDDEEQTPSEDEKEYSEMAQEVKEKVASMGNVSADEFKKTAFSEDLTKKESDEEEK